MGRKNISPKIIANRYASALYELAKETKCLPAVLKDLQGLATAFSNDEKALDMLSNAEIPSQERQLAIEAIVKKGKASPLTEKFLKVLLQERRFALYPKIVTEFSEIYDVDQKICRVQTVTATKLNKKQKDALEKNLKKALSAKDVKLETHIDPSVLGGILIRFGSTLVDDTIKNKLNRMAKKMKGIA